MRITESMLKVYVRGFLKEAYAIERKSKKEEHMMSLFKNPVDIAYILNTACGKVKLRKSSNTEFYNLDKEIIEKAMTDERLSISYDGGSMGVKDRLGKEDIDKIKGVLGLILSGCSLGTKNSCTISVEDVKKVTNGIKSYENIGR